ncbi:protein obstructor-E-like [Sabethes cyaneus]|uniref:protein obstructor-E-like n=1 Tax=Sabethes cyaneus TaxID=53552 RepID=UPI00237D6BE2|nr:protein obstructor-E-like [Sabethes cyaneus]
MGLAKFVPFLIVAVLTVFSIYVHSQSCPDKNGRFPVSDECDAYIECIEGIPERKLCPDGLLFNDKAGPFAYPCQYPIDVDCTGRPRTQPAIPTEQCPHQFGYYKVGDSSHCGQFMNCANGMGFVLDCPYGLAFNSATYQCDWPDLVADCDADAYLGFSCPPQADGLIAPIRFYRAPDNCQKYFICVDDRPRVNLCGPDYAFNELINACDGIENVTGCAI